MSEAANKLLTAVMELPEDERLALADAVYASLPEPPGLSEDDPQFDSILEKRIADLESGKVVGIPGKEFFKRLRERNS